MIVSRWAIMPAMAHLLIVDDEQSICWGFAKLADRLGHSAATAASAEEGLRLAGAQRPDLVVLDVRLPGMDGLTAMAHFRERVGPVPIVVVTAYGELGTAVTAVRNGAFDYLAKPFELKTAERVIERALAEAGKPGVAVAAAPAHDEMHMVGTSPPMQEVFKRIALVAASDACVHLRGESGTGKELAARAIHRYSRRAGGPFVAVNIASLSPALAESELFGHVRGAFTGAAEARKGLLEQADGGTIFLDEVADIPPAVQVKLLRTLEHGEVLPVGAAGPVRSDFRIISATHQNLSERVARGEFRHDLYFRLITFEIELPPLRERAEDVGPLVEHFLAALAHKAGLPRPAISADALAELKRVPWYGNVRELRNAVEHALVLARGGTVGVHHLPPPMPASVVAGQVQTAALGAMIRQWARTRLAAAEPPETLYEELLALVEPPLLEAAMAHSHGQCATAARHLGLHRTTLRKKLDQHGIQQAAE